MASSSLLTDTRSRSQRSMSPTRRRHRAYTPWSSSNDILATAMSLRRPSQEQQQQQQAAAKPPPRRLLVDYSKKRADLTSGRQGRQAQSERTLLLPKRAHTVDGGDFELYRSASARQTLTSSTTNIGRESASSRGTAKSTSSRRGRANTTTTSSSTSRETTRSKLLPKRNNTTQMSRSVSAREVVDWKTLHSKLDWELPSQRERRSSQQQQQQQQQNNTYKQHSSSCSNILRQSFLTKPLGTSSIHTYGVEYSPPQPPHPTKLALRRGTSTSPRSSPNSSPLQHEGRKKSILNVSTHEMKQGLVVPAAADTSAMMDASMRLGDVFGDPMNNSSARNTSNNSQQQQQQHPAVELPEPENETEELFHRLDKESKMLQQTPSAMLTDHGRMYRSMSALVNTLPQPPLFKGNNKDHSKLHSDNGKPNTLDTSKNNDKDNHNHNDDDDDDDASVISFRRSTHHKDKDSGVGVGGASKHKSLSQHLSGNLGSLPAWDGDFHDSLSSFGSLSSFSEAMSDLSSLDQNKKEDAPGKRRSNRSFSDLPVLQPQSLKKAASSNGKKKTAGNGGKKTSVHGKKRVTQMAASATVLRIHDDDSDEDDEDDQDLLFLPKQSKPEQRSSKGKATKPPPSASSSKKTNKDNGLSDLLDQSLVTNETKDTKMKDMSDPSVNRRRRRSSSSDGANRRHRSVSPTRRRSSGLLQKEQKNGGEDNLRFAFRRRNSREAINPPNLNSSSNSLGSLGDSTGSLGMSDDDLKKQQRDKLIRQQQKSQTPRRNSRTDMNGNNSNSDHSKDTKPVASATDGNRGPRGRGLVKQLSCDMLDCEYARLTDEKKKQQKRKEARSSRSVSPTRRNAALLVRANSERPKASKGPSSFQQNMSMSTSKLMCMSSSNPMYVSDSTTTFSRNDMNRENNSRDNSRPGPLDKKASSRRDRFRKQLSPHRGELTASQMTSSRSLSPSRNRTAQTIKETINRNQSRSFDDKNRGGFRESMMRQSSFVTGSRIRRIGGGGGTNPHGSFNNDGSGRTNNARTNLHNSSSNFSFI